MDLRKLRHACVLARAGTYVRAAEELHISQSALTRSVQQLEEQTQLKIFDRGRSGVQVTTLGRLFLERAADILAAVRGLEHEIGNAGKGLTGSVAFGLGPLPASIFLAPLLIDMVRNHAGVRLAVEMNTAEALLDSLRAERIEFCICSMALVPATRKLGIRRLALLPVGLFVRARHPLRARRRLTMGDLLTFPLVTGNMPAEALENVRRQSRLPADEPLPLAVACDDFQILKSVTANSDAVWLTSAAALADELEAGTLRELPLPMSLQANTEIAVVSLQGRTLSPAADLVLNKISAHANALEARPPTVAARRRKKR